MNDPTRVLHVIDQHSLGGAARAMLTAAKYTKRIGRYEHRILSLIASNDPEAMAMAADIGVDVVAAPDPDDLKEELSRADIVQLHWWNNPEMDSFLRGGLPACRLAAWFHVGGHLPPQWISDELVQFVDVAIASPYTYLSPAIQHLPEADRLARTRTVWASSDFERLAGFKARPHEGFNVGYIGTTGFVKLHSDFVAMCAAVRIPDVAFQVWGTGSGKVLIEQARQLGIENRFFFRGYASDLSAAFEELDIFGYPLCEDTYAASEMVLQEAMYAGIVPVVFPHGGMRHLVVDNFTGLVVLSATEYAQAIEYLYHHPDERQRMSRNCMEYAPQIFGPEISARALDTIYRDLLKAEKRERRWPVAADAAQILKSGAGTFCETLGPGGGPYLTSLSGGDLPLILDAEKDILGASALFRQSLRFYAAFYAADPHLKFWSGLAGLGAGRYPEAIADFRDAIQCGFTHWRIFLYLKLAAEKAGRSDLAQKYSRALERAAPDSEHEIRLP